MKNYFVILSLFLIPFTGQACQDINAKALKTFKDKNFIDLNEPIVLPLSSKMNPPQELSSEWDHQQKKKWLLLLPTTSIAEVKITDYRIFNCTGNMAAYYPCKQPLYQLRVQLNPKESCQKVQSDKMNISVLASVENKTLTILDYLFETNPHTHQLTPVGLMTLEDLEIAKKEATTSRL